MMRPAPASWDFPGQLRLDEPQLIAALAADLTAADYRADAVASLLGEDAYAQLSYEQLAPGRLALTDAPSSPLATLAAWWLFALPQPASRLAEAFPTLGLEGLRRLGLLSETAADADDAALAPACDLRPHEGDDIGSVWVASDLGSHHVRGALPHDYVLGIGQASLTLAQSVIREPVERALDLGTGCGIQLFHLMPHCEELTATDISDRALNYTAFNLLLNAEPLGLWREDGTPRVRLLHGSLLEPVAGEKFDLIVSNPPFVITPRSADENGLYTYRDGGLPGDSLVEQLIRALPEALAPGGFAQMLGNWEIREGASWDERPRAWIPRGTDAWIIQREETDTTRYALTWLNDAEQSWNPQEMTAALRRYRDDFASRGTESIGFGMVLLSRPRTGEPGWIGGSVFEEIAHPLEQPIGPHLGATVERRRLRALAGTDGHPAAADLHLTVAEDVTEERHQRPGAEHPGVILLRQGAGLRRTALLSSEQAGFVSAADGELSCGQIATALAAILEEPSLAESLVDEAMVLFDEGFLHISE